MSFNQLSNELLIEIIKWLGLPANTHVHNLALCSKRLNKLATPHLYDRFVQGTWNQDASLLTVLLREPQLGTFIKSSGSGFCSYDDESAKDFKFGEEDLALCRKRMGELFIGEAAVEKWISDLESKKRNALMGLLLSCMPRVREIKIESYKNSPTYVDLVLNTAAYLQSQGSDSSYAMSHLKSVTISPFDTESGLSLHTILPFLIPKSVTTAMFCAVKDELDHIKQSPHLAIETLLLDGSLICRRPLIRFLGCFKDLKKFRYNTCATTKWGSNFLPQTMGDAISPLKHCLEDLTIHTADHDCFGDEVPTCIGSLKGFKKLRAISMTTDVLFGPLHGDVDKEPKSRLVDILPKSLQKLELYNYDNNEPPVLEQLLELLARREELVPKLASIRIEGLIDHAENEPQHAKFAEQLKALTEKCVAMSVFVSCQTVGVDPKCRQVRQLFNGASQIS